jgi:hypothetical protein
LLAAGYGSSRHAGGRNYIEVGLKPRLADHEFITIKTALADMQNDIK